MTSTAPIGSASSAAYRFFTTNELCKEFLVPWPKYWKRSEAALDLQKPATAARAVTIGNADERENHSQDGQHRSGLNTIYLETDRCFRVFADTGHF
jgi:hypothetical protein